MSPAVSQAKWEIHIFNSEIIRIKRMYLNNAAQKMAHSKLPMNGIFIMAMRSGFYNDANTHILTYRNNASMLTC